MHVTSFNNLPTTPEFIPVGEFARIIGLHVETVRRAYRKGFFAGYTVRQGRGRGGEIYISSEFLRERAISFPTSPKTKDEKQ
ncbi:hypothetical protein [Roseomonas genomospecies 6]|uniref:hypothetical protein n=1 Tax=Roseomonas genomospecies 6 TaxID=214106 RepID=UPI0011F40694|nr:hypothetical protein [Roseomonas genomospecies 6]